MKGHKTFTQATLPCTKSPRIFSQNNGMFILKTIRTRIPVVATTSVFWSETEPKTKTNNGCNPREQSHMKETKAAKATNLPVESFGKTGQMTYQEFRNWVREMEYPCRQNVLDRDKVPFDINSICSDLGIRPNRFYSYWRGAEEGQGVLVSPSVTRLCRLLLARHRAMKLLSSLWKEYADEDEFSMVLDQISRVLTVPPIRHGRCARSVAARRSKSPRGKEAVQEADNLRNRARKLRRAAKVAPTADSRDRLILDAESLETRAFEIEEGLPTDQSRPDIEMAAGAV